MKDLGPLHYFLGIEVDYNGDSMHLMQSKYALDLLSRTKFTEAKLISSPTISAQSRVLLTNPMSIHWFAVKRILQNLKHNFDHGLVYRPSDLQLHAFSAAVYA
ncbi:hypothetical protein L3X38_010550 [Prunus dulcis]|uniref:Transposable element protein n=1 Tax=Prunus dulcis TaxID=3755 RepID=A0AAD4WG15_PRUDU|nr:hypothetical protein L3X38_010550 [Prunus dulcis]